MLDSQETEGREEQSVARILTCADKFSHGLRGCIRYAVGFWSTGSLREHEHEHEGGVAYLNCGSYVDLALNCYFLL